MALVKDASNLMLVFYKSVSNTIRNILFIDDDVLHAHCKSVEH